MARERASTLRAARYPPLLLAGVLAGCGSSGPGPSGDHSAAGVAAASRQFLADLQRGHYSEACEAFTAKARASMVREPGGCTGVLPYFFPILGGQLGSWLENVLPKLQVQGDTAVFNGRVHARYEGGRWHLENSVW